jgi:hypothetical protein
VLCSDLIQFRQEPKATSMIFHPFPIPPVVLDTHLGTLRTLIASNIDNASKLIVSLPQKCSKKRLDNTNKKNLSFFFCCQRSYSPTEYWRDTKTGNTQGRDAASLDINHETPCAISDWT